MQRRLTLALAALAALCLLVTAPSAMAAKKKGSKTDRAQNKALKAYGKAIKKNAKSIKRSNGSLNKQSAAVNTLTNSTKSLNGALNDLRAIADRADKSSAALTAGVPAIVKGLTDLKTGLLAAGTGLTSLQTAVAATEYGWIEETGPSATPSFHVTSDIPDAGQQAEQTITSKAGAAGNITTRFGVRGNESDGDGTTDAASCLVTIINLTTGTNVTSAFTPVPTKSTFQSVAGSPFAVIGVGSGGDVPVAGPSLAAAAGDTYTIRFQCVDTTPPSASNPGG